MERHHSIIPAHPGATLREDILPALKISKSGFARALGISRGHLYNILNETHPVTPEMAVRLGKLLNSRPGFWLDMQAQHDLALAERSVDVSGIEALESA
ncbi:HigA family addiction module antitoxin [Minwuia sp.]|uniref:HigA family addiction module antitoxin n=1 Tax=Minwuia sp. TaxID=2493630 RepID=UPI003A929493